MINEIIKMMKEMNISEDCINETINDYNSTDESTKKIIYDFACNLYEGMKKSKVDIETFG